MKWIAPARVERVVDGDTLIVSMTVLPGRALQGEHVRVAAINAPEMDTPEGKTAKKRAQELLPVGAKVWLTIVGADPYGRTIAGVTFPNGKNFGQIMLDEGQAKVYMGHGSLAARTAEEWNPPASLL